MGYRRTLLLRWSHRDRLAVLAVAVTVAFLTGAVLLLFAAGAQTTGIAAEYESSGTATFYESPAAADHAVAGAQAAVVVPVAKVTSDSGHGASVLVGVPDGTTRTYGQHGQTLRGAESGTTLGTLDARTRTTLHGDSGAVPVTVAPRPPDSSVFPPDWYITDTDTVQEVGPTGVFVITSPEPAGGGQGEVPLLSALQFFLHGTRQALTVLTIVAGGSALLVAVTIYSISRMTVRDRVATLRIIRATGGPPRGVLALFSGRAAVVTGVGIALGYAIGVIVANSAVNLSIAAGLPTSLSVSVTARAAGVLIPLFLGLLVIGALAGAGAAWPAVRAPPAQLTEIPDGPKPRPERSTLPATLGDILTPTLLDWRALWPTTATLTAFVAFVLLVAAMAGVAVPVASTDGATVTEPGSTHPVSSQIPADYAQALTSRGIDASPEILLFEVVRGEPVPARGARFPAFTNVTEATLIRGRPPASNTTREAVIGAGVADTLDVSVGDHLTLGGSTRTALTRVEVVGVFDAPGPFDDQLLVPLPVARHLSTVGPSQVNLIRAERLPAVDTPQTTGITEIAIGGGTGESVAPARQPFVARITVHNDGLQRSTVRVPVQFRGQEHLIDLALAPGQTRTATVTFDAGSPGMYQMTAGNTSTTIRVVEANAIQVTQVPEQAPPGSAPLVRVERLTGAPVPGATVQVGNTSTETGSNGYARLTLGESGTAPIRATSGNDTAEQSILVTENATRQVIGTLRIRPHSPSLLTRPEAELSLFNPWNQTVERQIELVGPATTSAYTVALDPGERRTITRTLARQSPGTYQVRASAAGEPLAVAQYRVTGDERIISALASGGRAGTTGIGQAIDVAFGNFQILLGALLTLAGVMTVGGTTATFAQAVHARRRTIGIHRATGADPLAVLRLVLGDALRIGSVATVFGTGLGLGTLLALGQFGYLVVFGVRLSVQPNLLVTVGIVLGGLGLTLLGALLATIALLGEQPAALLAEPIARWREADA